MLLNAVVFAIVDLIYLTLITPSYTRAVVAIQDGGPMLMRHIYALPVYLALGYIIDFAPTPEKAFLLGMAVYAVYDFTVLTLFHNYPLSLALTDTLWGGVLFYIVKTLMGRYFKVS